MQSVYHDGSLALHTRSLKYGKVSLNFTFMKACFFVSLLQIVGVELVRSSVNLSFIWLCSERRWLLDFRLTKANELAGRSLLGKQQTQVDR